MRFKEHVLLRERTSLRVGGPARFWCRVVTVEDVSEGVAFARDRRVPWLVLGGGTNIIPTDAGFDGLVIEIGNQEMVWEEDRFRVCAGAAMPMRQLVAETTKRGWAGLSWAGGLPGTLGGAIRGNAGAFGGEMKDSVVSVMTIDPQTFGQDNWANEACGFAYRTSGFKNSDLKGRNLPGPIIWEAWLQFSPGDPHHLMAERDEHIVYRQTRHATEPSAGSIFKNLIVTDLAENLFDRFPELREKVRGGKLATGVLLDGIGMKGVRVGGAEVSQKHANMIINPAGQASGSDIRALAQAMRTAVREHYGIELQEEPEFLD